MATKALLGAIIGDILHATFSDKNFVYDKNKPLLIEGSKITRYTVVILGVAKYIMDYHHLYSGPDEPALIEKRKELLVSTIIDIAKEHPELEYPEWLSKWLVSDMGRPTKVDDGMLAICLSPLVLYFSDIYDLESTLRVSTEIMNAFNTNKKVVEGNSMLTAAIYCVRKYPKNIVQDFMGALFHLRWPQDLNDLNLKYGWNSSLSKAIVPSLTILFQGDDEFHMRPVGNIEKALHDIVMIGGIGSLVTPLVVTMMPSEISSYMEEIESFRTLLPDDLLDINDRFLDFIDETSGFYFQFYN